MADIARAAGTILGPPRLKEGGDPRRYHVHPGARPGGVWEMQRADFAAFLLDEADREEHKKEIVGITLACAESGSKA